MDTLPIIVSRNKSWMTKPIIPSWIKKDNRLETVSLDQFFTNRDIANYYYQKAITYLRSKGIKEEDCFFIEPSAGDGAFFDLMPKKSRIGIDLCPMSPGIAKQDFLDFFPPPTNKKIVVIGNPPFGYRSWLALLFMQHASSFADYVFFILPMAFQSEGKGSPKNRIEGLHPVYSEILPSDSFHFPNGQKKKINALWQIWERGENIHTNFHKYQDYIELFTVDNRKERLCGQDKMKYADFFLQRTYYNIPPKLVTDFSLVRYVCGYGIIIKESRAEITQILNETNWDKFSNLAAHNCRHISMYHIFQALEAGGL